MHRRKRFARVEPELCIEAEHAVVIGGLDQPHAGEPSNLGTLYRLLRELSADTLVHYLRINGYRAYAGDYRAFIQKIAAYYLVVEVAPIVKTIFILPKTTTFYSST